MVTLISTSLSIYIYFVTVYGYHDQKNYKYINNHSELNVKNDFDWLKSYFNQSKQTVTLRSQQLSIYIYLVTVYGYHNPKNNKYINNHSELNVKNDFDWLKSHFNQSKQTVTLRSQQISI